MTKTTIVCTRCEGKMRVPTDRGSVRVNCPHCGQPGLYVPKTAVATAPEKLTFDVSMACSITSEAFIAQFEGTKADGKLKFRRAIRTKDIKTTGSAQGQCANTSKTLDLDRLDWRAFACPCCGEGIEKLIYWTCGKCSRNYCCGSVFKKEGQLWATPPCGKWYCGPTRLNIVDDPVPGLLNNLAPSRAAARLTEKVARLQVASKALRLSGPNKAR